LRHCWFAAPRRTEIIRRALAVNRARRPALMNICATITSLIEEKQTGFVSYHEALGLSFIWFPRANSRCCWEFHLKLDTLLLRTDYTAGLMVWQFWIKALWFMALIPGFVLRFKVCVLVLSSSLAFRLHLLLRLLCCSARCSDRLVAIL
jgi:hypothetical protein